MRIPQKQNLGCVSRSKNLQHFEQCFITHITHLTGESVRKCVGGISSNGYNKKTYLYKTILNFPTQIALTTSATFFLSHAI